MSERRRIVRRAAVPLLVMAVAGSACLGSGAIQRSYYVLHGVTLSAQREQPFAGLVRVRTLDSVTIYEKFQIVVRRSPYELAYSESDVWAVKPNRMVSDVIAEALGGASAFTSVARELGELRPDYILSGDLHALEVFVSDDLWFAHVALVLQLSGYEKGETLFTYKFDQRKEVPSRTFSQAARACSELLSSALDSFISQIDTLDLPRARPGSAKGFIQPENGEGNGGEGDDSPPGVEDPDDDGGKGNGPRDPVLEGDDPEPEAGKAKKRTIFVPASRPK